MFILKAPTMKGGYPVDPNSYRKIVLYYEVCDVVNGILKCEHPLTRDVAMRKGFTDVAAEIKSPEPNMDEIDININKDNAEVTRRINPRGDKK